MHYTITYISQKNALLGDLGILLLHITFPVCCVLFQASSADIRENMQEDASIHPLQNVN